MKKAAIYVKHMDNSWTSPKSMVEKCQEFAKNKQLEVVRVYCDSVKDSIQKRFDFERLLKDCKKRPFDCVIVISMANMTRKTYEICKVYKTLIENNIGLYSVLDKDELIKASVGESK